MKIKRSSPHFSWLVLAASVLILLGWWRWTTIVLIPSNTAYVREKQIPLGNNSDLYAQRAYQAQLERGPKPVLVWAPVQAMVALTMTTLFRVMWCSVELFRKASLS